MGNNTLSGFISYYASWRDLQFCIGLVNLAAFVLMYFVFPETSHPGTRGIDKLREAGYVERNKLPVFINPLRPLNLLRSPNVFWVVCLI
jgi:predicted MFS family arabinose efflux permease